MQANIGERVSELREKASVIEESSSVLSRVSMTALQAGQCHRNSELHEQVNITGMSSE